MRTLTIDVRARRAERLLGVLALFGVVGAGLLLPPVSLLVTVSFSLVTVAMIAGMWRQGWLGGARRLARIDWLPEGQWQLRDARHTEVAADLRADSRIGTHWLWLRWNAQSACSRGRSMLLVRGDIPDHDLRRLVVRLRLDAGIPPRSAAAAPVRDDDF
jgi:hypothetical protein